MAYRRLEWEECMIQAGLIYDDSRHYLDHLAPFCALLKWPLILCEQELAELASRFYPDLEIIHQPIEELKLPEILVTCETTPMLSALFPSRSFKHIWLPHGNSDKGMHTPFFEALQKETSALVYGQKIIDFMQDKKAYPKPIRIGNFRWEYFQKQRLFYETALPIPSGINFLYAPTWDDAEKSCSFWDAFPYLAARLPEHSNLIVKLHPNTVKKFGPELEVLMGRYAKQKNLIFLPDWPPIYPLLNQCSAYIGDKSSIGYDFLKFDRPLFFLNANSDLPLHRCGAAIQPETFDFSIQDNYSHLRKDLYQYTFDPTPEWPLIKKEIDALRCV